MTNLLFREANSSHQFNQAIYENKTRMIEWIHLALQAQTLSTEQKKVVSQYVEKLERENSDELYQRARRAMALMFDAGGNGDTRQYLFYALMGPDAKKLNLL